MTRAARILTLALATLVVVGIAVQVYLIGSYLFGAGSAALDAHRNVGFTVHTLEVLAFVAILVGYWRRWAEVALGFSFAVLGTVQLWLSDGERWVGGLHALLAVVVLVLAAAIGHRAMRDLGVGRTGARLG